MLAGGSLARLQTATTPQIRCHAHIAEDGTVQPEPLLEISPPERWATARSVLVSPISGVGVLGGWALGMESCDGPPLLVMFWLPPRTSGGGSTFGDVFVAWMPPRGPTDGALSEDGYGIVNEERYLRYGPNISQRRVNEAELGLHESRHVDQWAVGTILAGPLAFPAAYAIDGTLFSGSRNHFERDAGLGRGGYPALDGTGPDPQWPQTSVLLLGVCLIWRRRLRWLVRIATRGAAQRRVQAHDRCPVHTTGSPDLYAEDFSAAVDFLRAQPFVDSERVGALGICGSGGFVVSAAKIDPRIKAIATVSMYDMGSVSRQGLRRSVAVEQRKQMIAEAVQQRDVEFAGGETAYTGGTVHELTDDTPEVQREFFDFYRTPRGQYTPEGQSPQLTTHPTTTSNLKFMNFYPFNDIETISPRPMLFITGEAAHSREFSEDAYARAGEPKELVVVPGAGHVDLYDRVTLIPFEKLFTFFGEHLAAPPEAHVA